MVHIIFILVRIPVCIDAQIRRIDPRGIYQIPDISPLQPIDASHFTQNHLQPGLLNDSNCCCLISVLLCIHRLSLVNHLMIPAQMRSISGSSDYATGVLAKILQSFPSPNPFSLHAFIETWNRSRFDFQLGQNEDLFIIEGIMKRLRFQEQGGIPSLTKYNASYYCPQCQVQYRSITEWDNRAFEAIPELPLPNQQNPVHPSDLMTGLMNETFPVTCQVCQTQINDATYDIIKGKVTIIRVNRLAYQDRHRIKIMTPLDHGPNISPGSQYLGDLVAVVCHQSEGREHWVSYSKVDNGWFLNDDHRQPTPSSPLNSGVRGETINLLCYKN